LNAASAWIAFTAAAIGFFSPRTRREATGYSGWKFSATPLMQ
jgi:hypothetical protein